MRRCRPLLDRTQPARSDRLHDRYSANLHHLAWHASRQDIDRLHVLVAGSAPPSSIRRPSIPATAQAATPCSSPTRRAETGVSCIFRVTAAASQDGAQPARDRAGAAMVMSPSDRASCQSLWSVASRQLVKRRCSTAVWRSTISTRRFFARPSSCGSRQRARPCRRPPASGVCARCRGPTRKSVPRRPARTALRKRQVVVEGASLIRRLRRTVGISRPRVFFRRTASCSILRLRRQRSGVLSKSK